MASRSGRGAEPFVVGAGAVVGCGVVVTGSIPHPRGVDAVADLTRMSGKAVLVGVHQGEPHRIPIGHSNGLAYDLRNARFREPATILRGMDVVDRLPAAERLDLASSVTHRFGLENIDEAFVTAVAGPDGFVTAVVTMSDPLDPMTAPTSGPNR